MKAAIFKSTISLLRHIIPGDSIRRRVTEVIFAADAVIHRFGGFLNLDSLTAVWVIEHDTDGLVSGIAYRLNPSVFVRDVVSVGRGITPLDLGRVWVDEAINLEGLWTLASRVQYAQTARFRELVFEANLCRVFEKAASVLVEKSALVLIHMNQVTFLVGNAKHLVDEEVRFVIVFHLANAVVHSFLEVGSELGGKFTDFLFDVQV